MDGWNEEKLESLISLLGDIQNLQYEVENCRRGCYTGAETYAELGEKVKYLGQRLISEGEDICEMEEDEYDEED